MKLKEYQRKRDFRRTPEPEGNGATPPGQTFVVQKHAARRMHYDFRLEVDGVLKSWAVPKGPSVDPAVKSLAVHVEDHPLEYATFEGVIPEGEYGGGTVMVWDHGTWEPDGDPAKQYRAGKLTFRLHGEKLQGGWTLVRMSGKAGNGGKNWLLIKRNDKSANKRLDVLKKRPKSVVSGRPMQKIADDADRVWQRSDQGSRGAKQKTKHAASSKRSADASPIVSRRKLSQLAGSRRAELPDSFTPQLATLAEDVPRGDDWLHELKFDGYRILAFFENGRIRLVTRSGNDWTSRFSTIARALSRLPVKSAILDGEIVALNDEGQSDFQQLQNVLNRGNDQTLAYYVFDAPFLEGYDLTETPLVERKQVLAAALHTGSSHGDAVIRFSDHVRGEGEDVYAHACRFALEGVVSKRVDSAYQQLRAPTWLKVKCLKRQEFVIGGYTKPSGSRVGFGALMLGYYDDDKLKYAGRVGTGFTRDSLRQILSQLKQRRADASPFADPPRGGQARNVTWVRPELVGEVEFTEWTRDGRLRHPSFQGLREDKPAEQIVREEPRPTSEIKSRARGKRSPARNQAKRNRKIETDDACVAGVRVTHPDRELYPEQGLTKLELARFYEEIAERILPHIRGRPLTLVRCPQGRSSKCFFQKHLTDSLPDAVRGVIIQEKRKRAKYIVVDDLAGLISLVQMGVLEFHPWMAHGDQLEKPDRIVLDLDPGPGVGWNQVIAAARDVRAAIERHKLASFVQTSGGKGLHVVIPLNPGVSWSDLKEFARSIANGLASDQPDAYVATASKAKRKGKVFIDYLRSARGATSVAPYSTRARHGAPIATPIRWDELGRTTGGDQYTVANIKRRLAALKTDPWEGFFRVRQSLNGRATTST